MAKKPNTQPVEVEALRVWYAEKAGEGIEGMIVGTVDTEIGCHYVLEDEKGSRFRLPTHVDLDRKIQAAKTKEPAPWLIIKYQGVGEDDKTKLYSVQHCPRG